MIMSSSSRSRELPGSLSQTYSPASSQDTSYADKPPPSDMDYIIYFPHLQPGKEAITEHEGLQVVEDPNAGLHPAYNHPSRPTTTAYVSPNSATVPIGYSSTFPQRSISSATSNAYSHHSTYKTPILVEGPTPYTSSLPYAGPGAKSASSYDAGSEDGHDTQAQDPTTPLNKEGLQPWSLYGPGPESEYWKKEKAKRKRWKRIAIILGVVLLIGLIVGGVVLGLKLKASNDEKARDRAESALGKGGNEGSGKGDSIVEVNADGSTSTRPATTRVTGHVVGGGDATVDENGERPPESQVIRFKDPETSSKPSGTETNKPKPPNNPTNDDAPGKDNNSGDSDLPSEEDEKPPNDSSNGDKGGNSNGGSGGTSGGSSGGSNGGNDNSNGGGGSSSPPIKEEPPKPRRSSTIRDRSSISVASHLSDFDTMTYEIHVFYQDESNGIRRLVYQAKNAKGTWSMDALELEDIKPGTPLASTVYKRHSGYQTMLFYLGADNCINEYNFYKGTIQKGALMNNCVLRAHENSKLSAYWPTLHYQKEDGKLGEALHKPNVGWTYPRLDRSMRGGSFLSEIPIQRDYTGFSVFHQEEGDKVTEYGWRGTSDDTKRQYKYLHTFSGIPHDSKLSNLARHPQDLSRKDLDRHLFYQDLSSGDIMYYYVNKDNGAWEGPKTQDPFLGATRGTDIACITVAPEFYGDDVPETKMSLARCYFQVGKEIREVLLQGGTWYPTKTFDLS